MAVIANEGGLSRSDRLGKRLGLGDWAFTGLTQILLIVWAVMVIFPFLWMIMTSVKTDPEILFSPWKLPHAIQWDNYTRAWNKAHIGRYFLNTLIVIVPSIAGTLLISAMAAYVLARYQFRLRNVVYYLEGLSGAALPDVLEELRDRLAAIGVQLPPDARPLRFG